MIAPSDFEMERPLESMIEGTKRYKLPQRHLITDEVIEVPIRESETPIRIRIWRGREAAPVVLASQVAPPGFMWPGPRTVSSKLANFVNSAMLFYPEGGFFFFEDELFWPVSGEPRKSPKLTLVIFEQFGKDGGRPVLYQPEYIQQTWDVIELFAGCEVERGAIA